MKTPLQKLRGLAAKNDRKDRRNHQTPLQFDELNQADQDMQEIRDCYDRLLSAAAATANSAFEFSESLKEVGDCLLEKTATSDFEDEESGKALLMLGKVQLELQGLVDIYRSHIFRTITIPSESLINELTVVEEMKMRCDAKREAYNEILKKQRDKGKVRSSNLSQHLKMARDEYDEEENALIFRVRSLKQGQCRSLLTQAARHHAAQLCFFRKAFKSLEAIEPHVKSVTAEQHIDYQFDELEDEDSEYYSDEEDESGDGSELSFDNRKNKRRDSSFNESFENNKEIPVQNYFSMTRDSNNYNKNKISSMSAPLVPGKRIDTNTNDRSPRFTSYALPTPEEAKSPVSVIGDNERRPNLGSNNLWHSSPLDQNKYEKMVSNAKLSGPMRVDNNNKSILREKNNINKLTPLPPPLSESLSPPHVDFSKKVKRQAFSGPLTSKPWLNKPPITASGPLGSTYPSLSGPLLRVPLPQPSPARKSFNSTPKISELHELPRPPPPPPPHMVASKRPTSRVEFSAPLGSQSPTNKYANASTLPRPPPIIPRSYSIPYRGQTDVDLHSLKPLKMSEDR